MANNMPSFREGLNQLKKRASALQNNVRNRGDQSSDRFHVSNNFSNANQYEYDARRAHDRPDTGNEKKKTGAKLKQRQKTATGYNNVYSTSENVVTASTSTYPTTVVAASTSTYPTANPIAKHDILCPSSLIESIIDDNYPQTPLLLKTIDEINAQAITPLPAAWERMSIIYTYPDGPKVQISRQLQVCGLVPRDLFNKHARLLQRCTIAVKLPTHDNKSIDNTESFSLLVKYLLSHQIVAALVCDSVERIGFIVPRSSLEDNGSFSANLYYAHKDILRQTRNNSAVSNQQRRHELEGGFNNNRFPLPRGSVNSIIGNVGGQWGVDFRGGNNQNSTGRAFGNVLTNQPRPSNSNKATKPPPSLTRSTGGSSILRELKEKKEKLDRIRMMYKTSLKKEGSIINAFVDATLFAKQIYHVSEEEAVSDVIEILCEHLYIDLIEFEVDKLKKEVVKLVTPAILSTNEPTVESLEEEMKLEYAIRSISLEIDSDVGSSQHVRSDFVLSTLTNTTQNVLPNTKNKKVKAKAKAKKKRTTDLIIDKEANIPAFIQHIDEARSSFNSQDYSGALSNYNKALSLEVPDETVSNEILLEAIQCLSVCKHSDLEGLKTASHCSSRCIYYLRRHRGCGVDVLDPLISCHHNYCRVLCQLMNCEGVSHEDALLYCNLVNKSIGFISSVNIEHMQERHSSWLESIKDDCQLYKTIAQTKLGELKNEFVYQHPEDEPVLKTMDACGGNEDVIDVCREIFHSDADTLSDIESILQQQMELANEAKAGQLPQQEYERRYDNLRVKLVDLIEKLTGRVANLGYGLRRFLVLYWMNYCPPSLKDYICQLFKANKIDPTSCCPGFMLKSLVTVLTREAGGTDDDTLNTVLNDSAFVDLLCWVCDSNESSEYVKEIPAVEAALQSTKLPELVQRAISLVNITLIVTFNNVYHNSQPTIVALGANSRDKGCNKKKMDEIRANPEATFATSALHPQMAMDDRYCQNADEDTLANSSKVGVLVNSVHDYTVTVPYVSLAYQKFAGIAGMSKEELAEKALTRHKIRQKGGRNCMKKYGKNADDQYNRAMVLGEMSMALLGKNDKGDSVRASSMGDTTFARKAGLFNPKNAAAVKAGNKRGGGIGGNMNTEKQQAGRKIAGKKGTEKQNASRKINIEKSNNPESRKIATQTRYDNLKNRVLAAKKDYAIVTCRYCKVPKEYFFLWSEYKRRMSEYEKDSQKKFRPNTSKVAGCENCRSHCIIYNGGSFKVVKVLVNPRNGNEIGRKVVIE